MIVTAIFANKKNPFGEKTMSNFTVQIGDKVALRGFTRGENSIKTPEMLTDRC
jgi:hypothetical protein